MTAFARLASTGCPSPAALALAMACELHDADIDGAIAGVRRLADGLADLRDASPEEQLEHAGREVGAAIRARVRPASVEDLLVDHALVDGAGDPVCWAMICLSAAGEADIPLGAIADDEGHVLVAHRRLRRPLVVEPLAPDVLLDARELPSGELRWRCSHQLTLMLADRFVARATRTGSHGEALRAARLRLDLPLDDATREALAAECDRIAARMN